MYDKKILFLFTLPVEIIYRILDNLDEKAIFLSMRNVCQRLDTIVDTYHRYQVKKYQKLEVIHPCKHKEESLR